MFKSLKPTINDPQRQQQFDAWMAQADQFPEFVQQADKAILLHKDYSRVISEHRNNLTSDKARYESLVARLDEVGIKELILDESPTGETTTAVADEVGSGDRVGDDSASSVDSDLVLAGYDNNQVSDVSFEDLFITKEPTGTNMKKVTMSDEQATLFEQFLAGGGQQQQQVAAPIAPAATVPNDEFVRISDLPSILGPVFEQYARTTAQVPLALTAFTDDYNNMVEDPTKRLNPTQVASEWAASGVKDFNQFVNQKYEVATVEAAYNAKTFEKAVNERASQLVAAQTVAGGTHIPGLSVSNPLFDAISGKPSGIRDTPATQIPNSQPANGGQQQQTQQQQQVPTMQSSDPSRPARQNSDAAQSGIMAAAAALATQQYANSQFDPTRQMS